MIKPFKQRSIHCVREYSVLDDPGLNPEEELAGSREPPQLRSDKY